MEFFRKLREELKADAGTAPKAIHDLALANYALASTTDEIGGIPDAIRSYTEAITLLGPLARENPSITGYQADLAKSHNNVGILLCFTSRTDEAMKHYSAAKDIRERLVAEIPARAEFQKDLAAHPH